MEKINVLHVLQNSNVGGVQQQLLSILRAYDRDLVQPVVCSFKPIGGIGEQIMKSGIDVVSLGVERHHRFSFEIIFGLYRLMKQRRIHVVRTHRYRANFYGRIAAGLARVPVVIPSLHDNYEKDKRWERRLVNRLLALWTSCFVAVSDSIRLDIIQYDHIAPDNVLVIRNGVDTDRFSPLVNGDSIRKELGISPDERVIGFVGRLVPAKGLPDLVAAFAEVVKDPGRVRLLIVGGGQLLQELREMAQHRGLGDTILFLGERNDVPQILTAMNMFVMSSLAEGLPNSLLEAMAAARPVIVTTAGGMGEIVREGENGLIVPIGNTVLLAAAMQKLLHDRPYAEKLGAAARQCIERSYSIRSTAKAWEDLYVRLLSRKGGTAMAGSVPD